MTLPTRANADAIEAAYAAWLDNPANVDATWRAFFQGFTLGQAGGSAASPASLGDSAGGLNLVASRKQIMVARFINAYRAHGHLEAHLDPLSAPPPAHPRLSLDYFEFTASDLDESFTLTSFQGGGQMKLRDIAKAVRDT